MPIPSLQKKSVPEDEESNLNIEESVSPVSNVNEQIEKDVEERLPSNTVEPETNLLAAQISVEERLPSNTEIPSANYVGQISVEDENIYEDTEISPNPENEETIENDDHDVALYRA